MNPTLQNLMQKATQLVQSGHLTEATETIQRLLRSQVGNHAPAPASVHAPSPNPTNPTTHPENAPLVLDGCVFEVKTPQPDPAPKPASQPPAAGEFISGTHTHAGLTRCYKLYVPPGHAGQALPLVVMLHGCTQNPDDFAAGTGMNQRALAQGFLVLYPEQSSEFNSQACWNWFKHNHQKRGAGEPALIASLTQTITQRYALDARRVYVAGMSAGGAMAAVLAAAYPDVYAAVGVHSGLPAGAASNLAQALLVMKSGHSGISLPGKSRQTQAQTPSVKHPPITIPTIVFHGDEDTTVHPRNAEKVIASVQGHAGGNARVEQGVSARGRRYTRSVRYGDQGNALSEHWLVHGSGHAWSGGLAAGSYTDSHGPDATAEMLRFFFSQRRKASAV